ncbi:undecaprenyl-diphosphate phosphatase [Campylobacter fetus]|uniref:Undecaprenyl-diphosphatase n=1 Tax=Campylobacter fetus subsp. testudinum TaxID=1507806 RepID=A0AAX0HDL9_CAMFE|nr:undecaprenyl-diphosphate phosphatase [Campylobacter fetus]AGZ82069.1 undecaprenyl pyrophosphate phosphatase [Campylobacter fetus subsp. testudinum 03-427]AVK81491.1 undecaprenyl-diphosphate phosphatase [Campylobacter fetus subsp. testudinum]EAI4321939.1 undecaprenyl-diphosphate phosphatase [Campylobacter fetus]EAI4390979.1 undecaprenyl-diphosphate phosphatase [Campylobacter fetus]EAK0826493.1 undecaprenyl-diphosphate phosphatase [Campylobacter fetus]
MDFLSAIILGIVEGLTEFLPVSSTGHMILSAKLLGLEQTSVLKCFEVVIQLGSILAVVFMFFDRLKEDFNLWIKLMVGFVPTAIIGFLAYKHIKALFEPNTVAYMLIIGGIVFIVVELWHKKINYEGDTKTLHEVSFKQAFIIGLSQCFAMVPGTSRSGSTIITGLLCGLSREVAARFSFLLAIPTMFAATAYDTYKNVDIFVQNVNAMWMFLLGGFIAFVVAFVVIKLFLKFVSKFSYISFGIYRIVLGSVFLIYFL